MDKHKMDELTTAMMEHVCDKLCRFPVQCGECGSQGELEDICAECKMGNFVCRILNAYNQLYDVEQMRGAALLKKQEGFICCEECRYCKTEEDGSRWCRSTGGLDGNLSMGPAVPEESR